MMRKHSLKFSLFIAVFSCLCLPISAQEVVHALTGKLTSVNPATKTISVDTDDGSEGVFKVLTDKSIPLDFNKEVKDVSTPAADFSKAKATEKTQILVFYIGDDAQRTAVAVEDLGAGPFQKTVGTIVNFDRHSHILTVKDSKGAVEPFHLGPKTVAEGTDGVELADRFEAHRGDQIRVIGSSANGTLNALFIREM
jgi:hypothetical protein